MRIDDEAPIRGQVGCSVFVTRVVRGIDASRPTPPWMASRLRLSGVRSISLTVDITNYVMLELGPAAARIRPRHARGRHHRPSCDARARPLETLDGRTRKLDPEDLLITDDEGPIGIAGVMGGARTESGASTTRCPHRGCGLRPGFDRPLGPATQAAERGVQALRARRRPRGVADAAATRAAQLLVELAGGTLDVFGSARHAAVGARAHRAAGRLRARSSSASTTTTSRSARPSPSSAPAVEVSGQRLHRHPAHLAPRPHRRVHARRGGRATRRLRPHPVRAARRAARPRSDPRAEAPPLRRRVTGRGRREWRSSAFPFVREADNALFGAAEGVAPSIRAGQSARRRVAACSAAR